jgi:hypothetical protein
VSDVDSFPVFRQILNLLFRVNGFPGGCDSIYIALTLRGVSLPVG